MNLHRLLHPDRLMELEYYRHGGILQKGVATDTESLMNRSCDDSKHISRTSMMPGNP